jgi:hypothetical protein
MNYSKKIFGYRIDTGTNKTNLTFQKMMQNNKIKLQNVILIIKYTNMFIANTSKSLQIPIQYQDTYFCYK